MAVLDVEIERRALAGVETLGRLATVRAAYIFGSHVEGKPDQWSDIDLAAFMEGIEDWDIEKHVNAMGLVRTEAGSDVEAHLFPASALEHPARGSFAQYILKHGVCILKQ
jgi:predicted nucleotidyltransferase